MDIRQLTYFMEVAREGSLTGASKILHISQPGLSKVIKNLENELGVLLIDRSEKTIQLTDAGQELFHQSQKLLSEYEALTEVIRDTEQLKRGHVRVGVPPVIGTSYFPSLIAGFRELYSGVTLTIVEEGARSVADRVDEGSIDAAVVILPVCSTKFEIYPIVTDENKLIVHTSHPLAKREFVSYEDLEDENFVLLNENFMLHHHILSACREAGFEPKITFKSSQWDFLAELVAMNQGISILPRPILERFNSQKIVQLPIRHHSVKWEIAIILKKGKYQSFALRRFLEFVQENIQRSF
ncbi:LysR family transcriptional regulator [Cytobacillus spongiae]|uniref:LysR family transcriptional regulator n=1 Tax=Cytobacillus spongiae TaxID=2901381 RepID=UPI001F22A45F|nr:LysR family transcriptional regulator [Cytobacillus spongiae]UII57603.1 LysR family transcriptional regulator [Cytobacillus spongiae]